MAAESERHYLYQLIISQLHHDGFIGLAEHISHVTTTPTNHSIPKGKLDELVQAGLEAQTNEPTALEAGPQASAVQGIDLDQEVGSQAERETTPTTYDTCWIATHKIGCTAAAFSSDGMLVATGSQDTSIKLIDVEKIRSSRIKGGDSSVKAVLRTLYDHTHRIAALDFHPSAPILGSASDLSIKFFDLRESAKRVKREMKDTHAVRAIKFHPSGDYLLVGAEHHFLRLYECSSRNSYISSATEQSNQHQLKINSVDCSFDGRVFATSSDDGSIKLWDGRTLAVTTTYSAAHNSTPVVGAKFSRNGKYILSTGNDKVVRLWDIAAGKPVSTFNTANSLFPCAASFTYNERHVLVPDGANGVQIFDTLTGVETQHLYGHTNGIHCLVANTTDSMFVSCSEDARARFWTEQ